MFLRVTCLFLMLLTAGCGKGSTSSSQPSGTVVDIHFVLAEPDFVHFASGMGAREPLDLAPRPQVPHAALK